MFIIIIIIISINISIIIIIIIIIINIIIIIIITTIIMLSDDRALNSCTSTRPGKRACCFDTYVYNETLTNPN